MSIFEKLYSAILVIVLVAVVGFDCNCKKDSLIVNPPTSQDSTFGLRTPFWSADGKKIIGISRVWPDDFDRFYEVDSAGGYVTQLMKDSLAKTAPVPSPDRKMIAYLAADLFRLSCCAHVWVVNVDGTGARDLTPFGGNWRNVRWSPDSRYLTFDGNVEDSGVVRDQIVLADVNAGTTKLLTTGQYNNGDASWTNDGKRIVFESGRIPGVSEIFIMNTNGDSIMNIDADHLGSNGARPSPSRSEMLFGWDGPNYDSTGGTYRVALDTTSFPAHGDKFTWIGRYGYGSGQWSPDGNLIAGTYQSSSYINDLYVTDRDGTNQRKVTNSFYDVSLYSYAWSPDSKRLVFNATEKDATSWATYTYDLTTQTLRKLNIYRK